jgi:nucleotide-binding universal stress UspA family protein
MILRGSGKDGVTLTTRVDLIENVTSEDCMKIMVGYNGLKTSQKGIDLAMAHAKAFNGRIVLVASMDKATDDDPASIDDMEKQLEDAKKDIADQGIACETRLLVRGLTPGEDIVDYAREHHIGEIILTIQQTSKVGKIVFGSSSQYVILHADCPVVTIK